MIFILNAYVLCFEVQAILDSKKLIFYQNFISDQAFFQVR